MNSLIEGGELDSFEFSWKNGVYRLVVNDIDIVNIAQSVTITASAVGYSGPRVEFTQARPEWSRIGEVGSLVVSPPVTLGKLP